MASYVKESLIAGEELLHLGHLSLWSFWKLCLLAVVTLPIGVGLLIIGWIYLTWHSTELAVTDRRVIVKTGLFRRETYELFLDRIEGVMVEQSVTSRMLDYGTVRISGIGTEVAPVENVDDPLGFRRAFMAAADNFRVRGRNTRNNDIDNSGYGRYNATSDYVDDAEILS